MVTSPLPYDSRISLRALVQHLVASPEYYEDIERYKCSDEFERLTLAQLHKHWRLKRQGVWIQASPPNGELPVQGWKIHVSSSLDDCTDILKSVAETCAMRDVPFKFIADRELLRITNSKEWPRGSSGKFITIYPNDDAHFVALLELIHERLARFQGPYILSDQRYKDSKVLHYRFGGFTRIETADVHGWKYLNIVSPSGVLERDERGPFFQPPTWASQPLTNKNENADETTGLGDGRFIVEEVLRFTNAGGVYKGRDLSTHRQVVLKESRPFAGIQSDALDSVALREREWRLLQQLGDTGVTPRPIALFRDWEHTFLVEEWVEGKTLWEWVAQNNILIHESSTEDEVGTYNSQIERIAILLCQAIQVVHAHGLIVGDISYNNFLLADDLSEVKLIDLEAGMEVGVDSPTAMFTPGFRSAQLTRSETRDFLAEDCFGLGMSIMTMLLPIHNLMHLKPNAVFQFLSELRVEARASSRVCDVVSYLVTTSESRTPTPEGALRILKSGEQHRNHVVGRKDTEEEHVEFTSSRIADYVLSTIDWSREDRLFPSPINMVNPVCVAQGAFGIARFLRLVGREECQVVADWAQARCQNIESIPPGLYLGASGISWCLLDLDRHDDSLRMLEKTAAHSKLFEATDLFSGCAGFGLTCLNHWSMTKEPQLLAWAEWIGDWLSSTLEQDDTGVHWQESSTQRVLGYAHGSSGVALFLLYLYLATDRALFLEIGRKALAHDLAHAQDGPSGRYISFPRYAHEPALHPYWYVGSAGIGAVVLRYGLATGDEQLIRTLWLILPDVRRKYAMMPGLFNGLAGMGNLLLDVHQFLPGNKGQEAARKVMSGIKLFGIDRQTGLAFPGEHLLRISCDFGMGCAGIGSLLHRLETNGPNFNFLPDSLMENLLPIR